MKPHDYASWLRGSLTAHPCADSELAQIHSGHPAGLFSATSPPRNGIQVNSTAQLRCAVDSPARSCRRVLDGSAASGTREGRASSAAAQDVPSAELGQCLRTRTASPCGRQAIGPHLLVTFLCEQKSDWVGGSRTIRLTSLATAVTRATAKQSATAQRKEGRV